MELTAADFARLPELREGILAALESDFQEITVNLRARGGIEL